MARSALIAVAGTILLGAAAAQVQYPCSTDAECTNTLLGGQDFFIYCNQTTKMCTTGCSTPYLMWCHGAHATDICTSIVANPNHCGGCWRHCLLPTGATGTCASGVCTNGTAQCPSASGCDAVWPAPPVLTQPVPDANVPESADGMCGPGVGKRCPAGRCCSADGKCGVTPDFCNSTSCVPFYGSCNNVPPYPAACPTGVTLQPVATVGNVSFYSYPGSDPFGSPTRFECNKCEGEGVTAQWSMATNSCVAISANSTMAPTSATASAASRASDAPTASAPSGSPAASAAPSASPNASAAGTTSSTQGAKSGANRLTAAMGPAGVTLVVAAIFGAMIQL